MQPGSHSHLHARPIYMPRLIRQEYIPVIPPAPPAPPAQVMEPRNPVEYDDTEANEALKKLVSSDPDYAQLMEENRMLLEALYEEKTNSVSLARTAVQDALEQVKQSMEDFTEFTTWENQEQTRREQEEAQAKQEHAQILAKLAEKEEELNKKLAKKPKEPKPKPHHLQTTAATRARAASVERSATAASTSRTTSKRPM